MIAQRMCWGVLLTAVAVSLSLASSVASAEAIPIYLDFGDTVGVPTSPGTWNALTSQKVGYAGSSIADLLDSAGNSTGIGVSVTDSFWSEGTAGGNWNGSPASWAVQYATDDNFSVNYSTGDSLGQITFTGLTAAAYDFSVIASRAVNPDDGIRSGTYLINGIAPDNHVGPFSASADGWIARKIMTWEGVTPVANTIVLTVSCASGQIGYLNALSFQQQVPEPGTLAMTPAVLAGLLCYAWRRRR